MKAFAFRTFVLLLFFAVPVLAEPTIKLRMDVSPREITIGDQIQCNVTVIFSSSIKAVPLAIPATGPFELLAYAPPEVKVLPDGNQEMSHQFYLTTFTTGVVSLPPFLLNFVTDRGEPAQAQTQALDITVVSLLEKHGDEGQLRPLKGPYNFRSYFWLWFLLCVVIAGLAVYFGLLHIRNKKHGGAIFSGPPQPPEETAWEALHELEDSDLLESGQIKEYYSQLSTILRTYLENRYEISGLDRTTSELLSEVRRLDLPMDTTSVFRTFIENSDLVKFARLKPSETEIEDDLNRVKQFVTLTTPQKTPEPEKIPV